MDFKVDNFWVLVNQGFPFHEWNENHPFAMYTIKLFATVLTLSSWKLSFIPYKFWVPVNQGFPSHEWNENIRFTMFTIDLFTKVLTLSTWKLSFKLDKL